MGGPSAAPTEDCPQGCAQVWRRGFSIAVVAAIVSFVHPVLFAVVLVWCVALSYFDVTRLRLPNTLTLAGAIGLIGYASIAGGLSAAVVGGLLLASVYLVVHVVAPAALGAGDVKLAFPLGGVAALAGANAWVWAAVLAPVGTAVVGGALLLVRRARHVAVPHGPFMCAATLLVLPWPP